MSMVFEASYLTKGSDSKSRLSSICFSEIFQLAGAKQEHLEKDASAKNKLSLITGFLFMGCLSC